MGTRCLTVVQDEAKKDVIVMYRQFDGYPEGHGAELANFLKPFVIVNGYSLDCKAGTHANGIGCLAAQLVAHFKKEIGGFYLHASGTRDVGEEFTYVVTERDGKPYLEIYEGSVAFFGQPGKIPAAEMPQIWQGYAKDFSLEDIATHNH